VGFSSQVEHQRPTSFAADITERNTDQPLSDRIERLRLVLHAAALGTWDYSPITGALVCDARCRELFGLPPNSEINYETFLAGLHPNDRERVHEAVQRSFDPAGHGSYDIEYRTVGLRDGGVQRWIHATGRAFFNDSGQAVRFIGAVEDITARKEAEAALRESEAKYRNLFEHITEEVHLWQAVRDEQGAIKTWRLVDANPPTLKTWGRNTLDEIRGKTTGEIFGPGATGHYLPVVQGVMTEGVPYSFEDYLPNLDKYFRFTSLQLGDYFITTGADITAIKKAHEALRESESFYRQTLESIPGMVFTTRPDGYCDYQSQPWVDYTGVPMSEHLGDGWNKLLHPDDRPRAFAAWRAAVEGTAPYDLEYRVRRHDGVYEWFKVIGGPFAMPRARSCAGLASLSTSSG
jgi:PAS domain S-box-containing protein